jgi:hypothetical protein
MPLGRGLPAAIMELPSQHHKRNFSMHRICPLHRMSREVSGRWVGQVAVSRPLTGRGHAYKFFMNLSGLLDVRTRTVDFYRQCARWLALRGKRLNAAG